MLEQMEVDAREREHLYEHDVGLSRLRRYLESMANQQLLAKVSKPVAEISIKSN